MHTRLMNGETLTQTEAHAYMGQVMTGEISAVRLGAALAALRVRSPTAHREAETAKAHRG